VGDLFVGETGTLSPFGLSAYGLSLAGGVLRQRVTGDLDAVLHVDAAAAPKLAEQRVQQGDRAAALALSSPLPVDRRRMHERVRPAQRELAPVVRIRVGSSPVSAAATRASST